MFLTDLPVTVVLDKFGILHNNKITTFSISHLLDQFSVPEPRFFYAYIFFILLLTICTIALDILITCLNYFSNIPGVYLYKISFCLLN